MPTPPLKILLVEDDELFRLGLRVRLQQEPDLEIVAEADDGETAIELVEAHPIDIVLLDVGLRALAASKPVANSNSATPTSPFWS